MLPRHKEDDGMDFVIPFFQSPEGGVVFEGEGEMERCIGFPFSLRSVVQIFHKQLVFYFEPFRC